MPVSITKESRMMIANAFNVFTMKNVKSCLEYADADQDVNATSNFTV